MSLDLLSEIEGAVLTALEAGDGVVPSFYGTRPRESEEHVSHAVTEALDYSYVMEMFLPLLRMEACRDLREAIARKYAEMVYEGIYEARADAAQERSLEWIDG